MARKKNKKTSASRSKRLAKKWFVGASGWGIDLEMGSGDATQLKKRSAIPLAPATKYQVRTYSGISLKDATIYSDNPLVSVAQGTSGLTRIGDQIHVKTLSCNIMVDTTGAFAVTSGSCYRLILMAITAEYGSVGFTGGVGSTDWTINFGSSGTTSFPDPRLCKVLCDEVITSRPVAAAHMFMGGSDCVLNMPFEYRTGSGYGTAANLYWVIIPNIAGGVGGVSAVATFEVTFVVSFEDR